MDGITLVLSLLPALFETVVEMSEALKRPGWAEVVAPAQAAEAPKKRVSGKRKAVGS